MLLCRVLRLGCSVFVFEIGNTFRFILLPVSLFHRASECQPVPILFQSSKCLDRFCVGLLSKIYYATASQVMNINDEFHGVCARVMSNSASFRQLTDQPKGVCEDGMNFHQLTEHMRVGFSKQLEDKTLTEEEIKMMTRLIMSGLDPSRDGEIDVGEYVATCSSNEVLQMDDIVKFFDRTRKKSCMERLFDDTKIEHDDPKYDPEALAKHTRQSRQELRRRTQLESQDQETTFGNGMLQELDRMIL